MEKVHHFEDPVVTRPAFKAQAGSSPNTIPIAKAIIPIALVSLVVLLAYSPTLFSFFVGDDISFTVWLNSASTHPELIWKEFCGPWMGGTEVKFYRPFVNALMAGEYLIWGANGLCFRITNLLTELLAAFMLTQIVLALGNREGSEQPVSTMQQFASTKQLFVWAIYSGALFALYPLHCEPVNWLIGRQDLLMTLFSLCSLWCYIKWRVSSQTKFFAGSLVSAILALLCKELAVIVAPLILAYELFFEQRSEGAPWRKQLLAAVKQVLPHGLILVAYLCLRKLLLGDFLGGYPDSMTFIGDRSLWIQSWIQSLRMMIVPINALVLGAHSPITIAWHILLILSAMLSIIALWRLNGPGRRQFGFMCFWILLSLAPLYKIFNIDTTVLNGRLAYMATAPLCVLLVYGISTFSAKSFGLILRISFAAYLALASIILFQNNLAWAKAGNLTNRVIQQLKSFYQMTPGDPFVYVAGVPLFYQGAYVAVNANSGITKKPFLNRDINNCKLVNPHDQSIAFGPIKDAISDQKFSAKLLYWDMTELRLKPVLLPAQANGRMRTWESKQLKEILQVIPDDHVHQSWLEDGALEMVSVPGGKQNSILEIGVKGVDCWTADFLKLNIRRGADSSTNFPAGMELLFKNNIVRSYTLAERFHVDVQPHLTEQQLLIPLRNNPNWSMGGKCFGMELLIPRNSAIVIQGVSISSTGEI